MNKLIFATPKYEYLAKDLKNKGSLEYKMFIDNEHYLKVNSKVENAHCFLIGGTTSDYETILLYDIASGLINQGCQKLSIIIPYFGYSTMERSVIPGEIVTAKNRAKILSSLPNCPQGIKFYLFDLHSEGLPFYFENHQVEHIYTKDLLFEYIKSNYNLKNLVLASTDAGRSKWVQSLANDLEIPAAFIYKERIKDKTKVKSLSAEVKNKEVLIYDDMIRSGSSLLEASKAYLDAGASSVSALTTHGVFPLDAYFKIISKNILEKLSSTNSHPNSLINHSKYTLIDLSPLIHKIIKN